MLLWYKDEKEIDHNLQSLMSTEDMISIIYETVMWSNYSEKWKYDLCLIWDVIAYFNLVDYYLWYVRGGDSWTELDNLLLKRRDLRLPLQRQSENCISFIYKLLENATN